MSSQGYTVPLIADVSGIAEGMNKVIDAAKASEAQAKQTTAAINKMNDEISSGAKNTERAISDQMQATVNLKKASGERAAAERIMTQVLADVSKKQTEGVKISEYQNSVVKTYIKNLEYAKTALKTATDPTQIKVLAKDMETLRDKIVAVYDRASTAVTPMNIKLDEAGKLVDDLSDSIMVAFSDEEMNKLGDSLNIANTELDQLGVLIDFVSSKMEGMNPESAIFKQLTIDIETANQMLGRTNEVVDLSTMSWDQLSDRLKFFQDSLKTETNPQEIIRVNKEISNTEEQLKRIKNAGKEGFDELGNKLIPDSEEKVKSLGRELQEILQQLAKMKMDGLGDTKDYDDLLSKATEIKKAITEVRGELDKTASSTKGLDALIESASLVTAGFNLAQGSMALFGVESESLEKVTTKLTAGIAILQGLQEIQVQLKNKESVANKVLTASQALYTTVVGTSTGALKLFRIALAMTGIGLIILALGALIANWKKLTESIKVSGSEAEKWGQKIDKIKAIAVGVGNAVLQFLLAPIKALHVLFTEGASAAVDSYINSLNAVKHYSAGFNDEINRQSDAAHRVKLEAQKKALEKQIEIQKAAGKDTTELERALQSTILALTKEGTEERKDAEHDFAVFTATKQKEREDARKKAAEKAKKDADEADKLRLKELERIKDFNRSLVDLEANRQGGIVKSMADGAQKEKEAAKLQYEREVLTLARQLEDFKGSEAEKIKLKVALDKVKEGLEEEHIANLWAIDVEYFDKLVVAQAESNKAILALTNLDKELELFNLDEKYKKIAEQYKAAFGLEKDFAEEKNKEIVAINGKYHLKELDDQTTIETAMIDLIKLKGKDRIKQEEIRENMRLQVILDAAYKRLEILKGIGGKENEVAIAQTKALIATLSGQITDNNLKASKKNLFQSLGLDVSEEDAARIVVAYKNVFSDITAAFQQSIDLQIQAKQKQIDTLTDQIGAVEREIDKEVELQKAGYAANVDGKKAELEALKIERDKEVAQQEELQKKQQKIALTQIAINGMVQASELGLAAAKIFKAHAGIPFAGVAIAAAAGLTMLTTMLAMKNQIKAMKSDVPSYRRGGVHLLNGPSHEQGGLGVYNERTGQRIAEVEGNEGFFAITTRNRHLIPLFEALNKEGITTHGGSLVDKGDMDNVVVLAQQSQTAAISTKDWVDNVALRDIAKTNRKMLENESARESWIDMNDHWLVKIGDSWTRKIMKRNHYDK